MRSAAFNYALDADRPDPVTVTYLPERPAAAATEQETKDQEDKTKIEAREAADFWRWALRDRVGKHEMFKLLRLVQAFERRPFCATPAGFPDVNATFYKAGQMDLGREVYQMMLIVAPAELMALQAEYNVFGDLAVRPDRQNG